ncbi:putative Acid phosphatase [Helianthus anomalus]
MGFKFYFDELMGFKFYCYRMVDPQPKYSTFREPSYEHATFEIKNRTAAYYAWHRNQDGYSVEADSFWFHNLYQTSSSDSSPASF